MKNKANIIKVIILYFDYLIPTKQTCTGIDDRARKARRLCVVREKQRFETKALLHARQNAHTRSTEGFSHLQLLVRACHLVALSGLIWLIPGTQRHSQQSHFSLAISHQ